LSSYTSKKHLPTEPMTGDKTYTGEPPVTFRPDYWLVSFRYHPFREPRYYLSGPRLKKDGTPTARASQARQTMSSTDVPPEVIADIREKIRKEVDETVREADEMLAMLDRDFS
jgi:hypothetical protein